MTSRISELLDLLREADETSAPAVESAVAEETVSEQELQAMLEADTETTSVSSGSDVGDILSLMEASEKESEEEEEAEVSDAPPAEAGAEETPADQDLGQPGFNDVDHIGLSDGDVDDLVAQAGQSDDSVSDEAPAPESDEEKVEEAPLPGSEDLSPVQKATLRKLFDSCVLEVANERAAKAVRLAEAKLTEQFKGALQAHEARLNEHVNSYLKYVVESWIEENKPQIHTNAQVKVAKKIFESVRSIVEMLSIETVDATAELVATYEAKLSAVTADANRLVTENARLVKDVALRNKALIIEEASKGLPLTDVGNFRAVVAKIKADDLDTFRANVQSVRESFIAKPKKAESIRQTNESLVMQGGIQAEKAAPKTEADFIASFFPSVLENDK